MATTNPLAEWISLDDLHPTRLDAVFYRHDSTENDRAIRKGPSGFTTIQKIAGRLFKGAFFVLSKEYQSHGIPFLRTLDIKSGFVSTESCVYLTPETHTRESKTAVFPGNLVLAKTGASIGYSAVVPEWIAEANVCQDLVGVRLAAKFDPHFVHAFLSTPRGQVQAIRWGQGNAHPHLGLDGIREWLIPKHDPAIQAAIGNKIRKAERLRELATRNLQSASRKIGRLFGTIDFSGDGSIGWLDHIQLSPRRLDAWFNQQRYVRFGQLLDSRPDLARVRTFCRQATEMVDWKQWACETFEYFEIGGAESQAGQISSQTLFISAAPSRAKFIVRPWDVLVSTVRPNLKSISIVPETIDSAVCSSGFSVLRAESPEMAGFLWACLMHDVATQQLMRWNTGATYPAIERSVPLDVFVPSPGDEQIQDLGRMVVNATQWNAESRVLVERAKANIEDMIDGTLDEEILLHEGEEIAAWLTAHPLPESERNSA